MQTASRVVRIALLFLFAGAGYTAAQVSTGTIVGLVEDGSGGAVANAQITLTQTSTGTVRETHTNDSGAFTAPVIPPGGYSMAVAAPGFSSKTLTGIELLVDQTLNLHVTMELGSVSQTVEVFGAEPLVDSVTSSLGQVIENKQILDMPLNGRNPFALGLLAGNTTPVFGVNSNLPFIAGGGRFTAVDVSLNGVDDNTISNAGAIGRSGIAIVPSVDAVQEFKVKTNNFSAEFGHAAGSIVSSTLKSGSNQFHGVLFEFLRNDKLDANNYFTNLAGLSRPPFHQNQFGATVGGPILHQRLFFFADYQGTRQSSVSGSSIANLPPTAFRTGDFSQSKTIIYDPTTRHIGPTGTIIATPFPGNKIPQAQLNPTSLAILGLIPAPNFGAAGAVARNYFYQASQFSNTDQGDVRIDLTITPKHSLFGSFSISDNSSPAVGSMPGFIGGGSAAVNNSAQATVTDVYIFTQSLINELRLGYVRHNGSLPGTGQQGVGFAKKAGLALFPAPVLGFPNILFNYSGVQSGSQEFTSLGGGDSSQNLENRLQFADNVTWSHGNHSVKFGGDVRNARFDTLRAASGFFGQTYFGAIFTSSSNAPGSGLPFADFLLGDPSSILASPMLQQGRQRDSYVGLFGQDDWRVKHRLTMNYGLRYELYTQPIDARNLGSLFDIRTGEFVIPGSAGHSRAMVDGDHNNLGPRFGLAYQVSPNFVARGGYGIFYGLRDQNQQVTQFSGNAPNIPSISLPNVSASQTVSPPFTINTPIVAIPAGTALDSFTPTHPYASSFKTQSFKNARDPMLMQYNLDLQYQLRTVVFEASYSGAKGTDLASLFIDQNQVPFSAALAGLNKQANRPYPNINGQVLTVFSTATSNYNAMNLKLEMQPSHGLSFLTNYRWQKNLETNGSGPNAFSQNGGTAIAMTSYDLSRERGVAPINVTHNFTASVNYELPFGPGKTFASRRGIVSAVIGGWVVNGIGTLRTGFPTDIRTNVLPPVFNTFNLASCVPGVPMKLHNPGVNGYFNPAAFTVPVTTTSQTGSQIQTFGNCSRRITTGPGSKNLDSSIFKAFHLSEKRYVEFRTEFFNTTNTPTFFLPSASDPSLTCQGAPGAICNSTNPTFGKLSNGTATGRQIQFALKLYY